MKRFATVLVILAIAAGAAIVFAQDRGEAAVTINGKSIKIDYGRPALAGRDMLSRLPEGRPWRMGMNSGTILTTKAKMTFNGAVVEPGTYRLWARKKAGDQWEMMISSNMGWYEEGSDVAVIGLSKSEAGSSVENLTIELTSNDGGKGQFAMSWATLRVTADFTAQ